MENYRSILNHEYFLWFEWRWYSPRYILIEDSHVRPIIPSSYARNPWWGRNNKDEWKKQVVRAYVRQERDWKNTSSYDRVLRSLKRLYPLYNPNMPKKECFNHGGKIQSDQIHKSHSNFRRTQRRRNSVGLQYLNFYGCRRTRDPQGSNVKTKWNFVDNVRYFWIK